MRTDWRRLDLPDEFAPTRIVRGASPKSACWIDLKLRTRQADSGSSVELFGLGDSLMRPPPPAPALPGSCRDLPHPRRERRSELIQASVAGRSRRGTQRHRFAPGVPDVQPRSLHLGPAMRSAIERHRIEKNRKAYLPGDTRPTPDP